LQFSEENVMLTSSSPFLFRFAVVLVLSFLGLAPAHATLITFEDLPDADFFNGGDQNIGNFYPGLTFGPDVTGLSVSRFGGYANDAFPPNSGDVVIFDASDPTITIDFSSPINSFGIWYTSFDPLTLQSFDQSNNLLGTVIGTPNTDGTTGTTSFISFSNPAITSVELTSTPGFFTLDDLTFQSGGSSSAPEPGTLVLLSPVFFCLALRALGRRGWRRVVRVGLVVVASLPVLPLFCGDLRAGPPDLTGLVAPTPPRLSGLAAGLRSGSAAVGAVAAAAAAEIGRSSPAAQSADVTPPQLVGLAFSPSGINVSSSAQVVTLTLQVTDDLSGADFSGSRGNDLEFVSPSGKQVQFLNAGSFSLISGTPLDGAWQAQMTFPQFAEPGTWTLSFVELFDAASNHVTLNTVALSAAGFPTTLTVTTTIGDTSPPQLTGLTLSRSSMDVSSGSQTVDLTLSLTDNLSGVDFNCHTYCIYVIGFTSPSGKQAQTSANYNFSMVSGTDLNGQWKTTITIPRYSEAGIWRLNGLTIWDTANNQLQLTLGQIQSMGFPSTLTVADDQPDTTPPTLTSLAFNPTVAGVSPFRQNIVLTLAASDDISGVDFIGGFVTPEFTNASVQLVSPTGIQNISISTYSNPFVLKSGNTLSGVWQTSFLLPGYSETGTWKVASITLRDSAANYISLNTAQLTGLGIATTFSVSPSAVVTIYLGPGGTTANPTASVAEPVNTATGDYYSLHTDLAVQGRGLSFVFARHYNSLDYYSGSLGVGWTHSYNILLSVNPQTGVVTIKNGDGSTASFTPSGATYLSAAGVYDQLRQNSDNSFTVIRKNQVQLNFSSAGQLLTIIDRNGNTQAMAYDPFGNLTSIADTTGRVFQFIYDSNNHLVALTDPSGRKVQYSYDGSSNLTTYQDALGGLTQYAYDGNHRIVSGTDPRGVVYVQNTYDSAGRVSLQNNALNRTTTFAYNTPATGTTTVTDPLGNATQYVYDSSLRIVQIINAQGGTVSYVYDANNDKTAITNANGKTTQFAYDGKGNVTSITNPLGNMASFTYDSQNDMLTATSPSGAVTAFSYDSNGNLSTTQDAMGNKTTLIYDAFGELVSRTDALGDTSTLTYDTSGNATKATNALGNITTLGYDAVSRVTSVTDGNGHTFTVTYDALSRRTKTTDALGHQTQYSYDLVGNLLKVIDSNGNPTAFQYDNVDNLLIVTDALGNKTTYGYDGNNNRTSFTNANGNTTAYKYDSLDRRVKVTDPLGLFSSYLYDAVGNPVSVTDANGKTHTVTYDAVNRPTVRTYFDGNTISYAYDVNGNRVSMTDSHGLTSYSYDILNRIVSVNSVGGSSVKYAYDAMGHRTGLTYPDGRIVTYAYDVASRLSQVADWLNRKTTYTYDPAGNRIATAMGNGGNSSFSYDNSNRLLGVMNRSGSKVLTSFVYSLDAVGNRTQVADVSGGISRYGYDALNRLTAWTVPSGQLTSYSYDAGANRTSMTSSAGTTAYTYDADDRLLTGGTSSYSYDGNGNRLTKTTGATTVSYTFDALNRLAGVSGSGIAAQYQYDGDGNRFSQQAAASTYQYALDVARRNPSVLNENGSDGNIDFEYGLTILSGSGAALEQFYQADGVGSTADVTDATDTLKASYTYDPWGKLLNPIDPLGTKDKFKFAGEALDPQTGLYYLRSRYYDPAVGRFISKDPLSGSATAPLSQNRYAYALANPLRYTDTLGLAADPAGGDQGVHSGALGGLLTSSGTIITTSLTPPPASGAQGPPGTFGSTGLGSGALSTFFSNFYGLGSLFIEIPERIGLPLDILTDPGGDIGVCPPGETCGSQIEFFPPATTEPTFNPGDYDYLHPSPSVGAGYDDFGDDFGDFGDA
jgi:RHS repeat-associated protein